MALNASSLISDIAAVFLDAITFPYKSAETVAVGLATAYSDYGLAAQSCAGLTPTVTNYSGLEAKFIIALTNPSQSSQSAAEKWADAVEDFWSGALFGTTGAVVLITGKSTLVTALKSVFDTTSNTLISASTDIGNALDVFTKSVNVQDTAVPPPTGCGPSPIY